MNRKPRADSKLKTLPEERQAALAEFLRDHGLEEARAWLRKDGIQTSAAAISEFLNWYQLKLALEKNESAAMQMIEDLKAANPGIADEALFMAGQRFFSLTAVAQQDSLAWKRAQDAMAKRETVVVMRARFEFDAAKACLAALPDLKSIEADNGLDERAKIERVRVRLFGEAAKD